MSLAQVAPDNTVGTQVNNNGSVAEITGGETRGENLFHSFEDFSVTTGNEAFFNNADEIGNIFSRVTGGNTSNIDGLIRANGAANLFLINPAGIMFGENASLSIGGSFYGSTADSVLFEGGEFSATDLDSPPLLTINAPIGFNFRDNPGDISSDGATLGVVREQTLTLLGGNLSFEGGIIGGVDSNVELGGLAASGTVNLAENSSSNFPESVARGEVAFADSAIILVAGENGGSVNINAQNLSLNTDSRIFAGINVDLGSAEAQAGDITIALTEDLIVNNSAIANNNFGTGNAGNVTVNARNIFFNNGGVISSFNTGAGNVGEIVITATEDIIFDGITSVLGASGVSVFFTEAATGDIGEINLSAQNLALTNGGTISSLVETSNDSGDVTLNIVDTVRIDGVGITTRADGTEIRLPSAINSNARGINGNSGNININTQNLLLNDSGFISSSNAARGNSGDININVDFLSITEQSAIDGGVRGSGNGSTIKIDAEERVSIVGDAESFSFITVDVELNATGQAGNIEINTPQLILQNAFISADVRGNGEGGTIDIFAADSIELADFSLIQANVFPDSTGNGGNLNINTGELTLNDGSAISATTFGNGNAGNISIIAERFIDLSGVIPSSRTGIFASALVEDGNGGNIDVTTGQLNISDGAIITASNFSSFDEADNGAAPGTGKPGNIAIAADTLNLESAGRIEARTQAETGTGANISLRVGDSVSLRGDSFISAEALGNANGGNLTIDTDFIIAFPEGNNDIIASAEAGQGGKIDITAESLFGIQQRALSPFSNDINASSEFGLDGSISIDTPDLDPFQGTAELSTSVVDAEEVVAQVCSHSRGEFTSSNLSVRGKGGIPPAPSSPLSSDRLVGNYGQLNSEIPEPLKTSKGDIQPARGIRVGANGQIILTAYPTDAKGDRLTNFNPNCG